MNRPAGGAADERPSTTAVVRGYPADAVVKHLLVEAEDQGAFVERTAEGWLCRMPTGDILLGIGGAEISMTILSDTPQRLQALRVRVTGHIADLSPELARRLVWSREA